MLFWKICFPFVSLPYPVFWNRFLLWKVQQIFNFHLSSLKMPREIKEIKASHWNILSRLNFTYYLLNFVRLKAIFMFFFLSNVNFKWKFDFFCDFSGLPPEGPKEGCQERQDQEERWQHQVQGKKKFELFKFLSFVTIFYY